ncbi:MAG: tRNA dihydrouridine synthase DusB [Bacteroidales bacterium]|nr:tRNA dihydrouridine synthase DusB [Bacteroidales bacterium]
MFTIGNTQFEDKAVFLAPLEDITDRPFRLICKELGADMVYTEFISSEGLIRDAEKSKRKLLFEEAERPIGIQIFGHQKESMVRAAIEAESVQPDLIDINWGCPVRKVVSKGAGSGILQDVPRMLDITRAVVNAVKVPVTVKTRLGWDENSLIIDQIAEALQDCGIAALTIHGRTRSQLYGGNADWSLIRKVKENTRIQIPIIGNGDITDCTKAEQAFKDYGVDAIMVGRAAIGYPWIFQEIKHYLKTAQIPAPPSSEERYQTLIRHFKAEVLMRGDIFASLEMRKFFTPYYKGLPNFKPFKMRLMQATSFQEAENILQEIRQHYQ